MEEKTKKGNEKKNRKNSYRVNVNVNAKPKAIISQLPFSNRVTSSQSFQLVFRSLSLSLSLIVYSTVCSHGIGIKEMTQ